MSILSKKKRLPVVSSSAELKIPWPTLKTIISGSSVVDAANLHVDSVEDARSFLEAYGSDGNGHEMIRSLAVSYLYDVVLADCSIRPPEQLRTMALEDLLVQASQRKAGSEPEWACILLKVCHAIAHGIWSIDYEARETAFSRVASRLEPFLVKDGNGLWIGDANCRIPIEQLDYKHEKTLFRVVTKLLQKKGNLSAGIYDHIGIRIVTYDIFSTILLIKFMRSRKVFMYANLLPSESRNSVADFREIRALFAAYNPDSDPASVEDDILNLASNPHSSSHFKMIKFIERLLVRTASERTMFFPCEFQIVTKATFDEMKAGSSDHAEYEKRQISSVRRRLFVKTSMWKEINDGAEESKAGQTDEA